MTPDWRYQALLWGMLLGTAVEGTHAQEVPAGGGRGAGAIRLFITCPCRERDLDYFRQELAFASFVRQREDAEVVVLITEQTTGAGGSEYTLTFIGQQTYEGWGDTLRYVGSPAESDDLTLQGLNRVLKLGLVRYAARTPFGTGLVVTYLPDDSARGTAGPVRDPWHLWVFRVSGSGFFNGEQSSRYLSVGGRLAATRITERWKFSLSGDGNYNRSTFELDDTTSLVTTRRSWGTGTMLVRSLGPHWSFGGQASASMSSRLNQDLALRVAPALEFNIFPYEESTRQLLTVLYSTGISFVEYREITLYDRRRETLVDQTLRVSLASRQPWGSANISMEGAHYFHDVSKHRVRIFGDVDLHLVRGLAFNLHGQYAVLHDQLYLPAAGVSREDILTQRRQLATSFQYFASAGLSYTFGSIYNNVVNARFGEGVGSIFR